MAPRGGIAGVTSAELTTAYSVSLLSEYTHTLDAVPLDLSRDFAGLRELDAVLSSSMTAMTVKINQLTQMLDNAQKPGGVPVPKEERLWLLTEIAEEASRLKLGGDDKIRVACQAADTLRSHTNHMRTLLTHIPPQNEGTNENGFESAVIPLKTIYPHVSARSYMPAPSFDTRSRRRGGFSSLLIANNNNNTTAGGADPSPAKRKRVTARDEDNDAHLRSPKKDRTGGVDPRSRNGASRAKKVNTNDRGASPADSILSITSHNPPRQVNRSGTTNGNSNAAGANTSSSANAARRKPATTTMDNHLNRTHSSSSQHHNSNSNNINRLPSSTHPSLAIPYVHPQQAHQSQQRGSSSNNNNNGYHLPGPIALQGPGLPPLPAKAAYDPHSANHNENGGGNGTESIAGDEGDVDGEDMKLYCFCERSSYGEMIACDDTSCAREWFHLPCVGLETIPAGDWYCETCRTKRNAKRAGGRSGGGGTRRKAGGRSGGR